MNTVSIVGRLTRDPDVRYKNDLAVARMTVAVPRPKQGDKEATSDFPSIVCFGKTAEMVERYLSKGRLVGISGRIQTGSYTDKDGKKIYTTDVLAEKVEFLDKKSEKPHEEQTTLEGHTKPEGFEQITDEDIPF